jgi:hypothetical protein
VNRALVATVLAIASAATVQKYAGTVGLLAYVAALALLAAFAAPWVPTLLRRATTRDAVVVAVIAYAVLLVVFAVAYAHAKRHGLEVGTDRDDAADLGARALLRGHYPYDLRTYLDQPISQLPGGLLLAVPFVAVGHSAYAAFFWLPVLMLVLRHRLGDLRAAVFVLLLALCLATGLARELLTGGDLIANGVAVLGAVLLVLDHRRPLLAAALLGFILAWRLNFAFALPALLLALRARSGSRAAVTAALVAAIAFLVTTLPFAAHEGRFWPLEASNHLQAFDGAVPGGGEAVGAAIAVAVVAAAVLQREWTVDRFLYHATFGQVALVLSVVALDSTRRRSVDFSSLVSGYGLLPLFFGLALAAPTRWAART